MPYLIMHCKECDRTIRFDGENTEELIEKINESDWTDYYDEEEWEKLPHGHILGFCPEHA